MVTVNKIVPMIEVGDLGASIAFYRDVVGFTVESTWPEDHPRWAMLRSNDAALMLSMSQRGTPALTGTLYFYPDDVVAMFERVKARANVLDPVAVMAYGMREFRIADPDGYLLTFGEPTDAPPDHDHEHPHDHAHPHTH